MPVKDVAGLRRRIAEAEAKVRELSAVLQVADEAAAGLTTVTEEGEGALEAATAAYARELRSLLGDAASPLSVSAAEAAARRAALVTASEYVWSEAVGPLFSTAEVRDLLGGVSRQRISELWAARRLIGVEDTTANRRFPAFQFRDGRVVEPLVRAFWLLRDAAVSGWTAASWCVAADPALDGMSPVAWLRDGRSADRLVEVAQRDAARLAQ